MVEEGDHSDNKKAKIGVSIDSTSEGPMYKAEAAGQPASCNELSLLECSRCG